MSYNNINVKKTNALIKDRIQDKDKKERIRYKVLRKGNNDLQISRIWGSKEKDWSSVTPRYRKTDEDSIRAPEIETYSK